VACAALRRWRKGRASHVSDRGEGCDDFLGLEEGGGSAAARRAGSSPARPNAACAEGRAAPAEGSASVGRSRSHSRRARASRESLSCGDSTDFSASRSSSAGAGWRREGREMGQPGAAAQKPESRAQRRRARGKIWKGGKQPAPKKAEAAPKKQEVWMPRDCR